jgi:small ligand-binding sensory domain FIST
MRAPCRAAYSSAGDWRKAALELRNGLGDTALGFGLGLLYVSEASTESLSSILTFLRETTQIPHWAGAVGAGLLAEGHECGPNEPGAAAMLLPVLPEAVRILPSLKRGAGDIPESLLSWARSRGPTVGLVHGDPRNSRLPSIITEAAERLGSYFVGGLTALRSEPTQIAIEPTEGGLSGVLFAADVTMTVGISQSYVPVGRPRQITGIEGNVIHSLDGRKALEILRDDCGAWGLGDWKQLLGTIQIGLPISGSDTGDYLVRPLLGIDPFHGSLSVGAALKHEDSLLFVRRDEAAARDALRSTARNALKRAGGAARGGVYISCVARGRHMFGAEGHEIGILDEALGDIPLIGFFANGEIANDRLYSQTGVLALFV